MAVTTTLQDWRYAEQHVQLELETANFVSAQTTLMCAGPPRLETTSQAKGAPVFALGVVENLSIQQQQQLQRVFELGSARSYLVPGVTVGGFNVGRLFIHGPSLLKSMYAAYEDGGLLPKYTAGLQGSYTSASDPRGETTFASDTNANGLPGYGDFFINLVSELFKRPIGVGVYMKDRLNNDTGAFYIEGAVISTHNMGWNAGSTVVAEGASFEFDRIVPINVENE